MPNPVEIIKQGFRYLIENYGFQAVHEQYSPEIMGNAEVIYKSRATAIKIVVDRSQVLINIGKISWPEREWFEFSDVIHFFDLNIMNVYDFPSGSTTASVDAQVTRLAQFLRKYGEPLLVGDFSMETQIREIEQKRVKEMLEDFKRLSRGKNEKRTN
jgi:hypothetical protein